MSKYFLVGFLFGILFSLNTYSETKPYFVVLKKPIPLDNLGVVQSASVSVSSQLNQLGISGVFGHDKIGRISLFSQYVRGVSTTGIGPLNNDSKEEYTYLIHLEETHINDFLDQVKLLDDYVHVQPNFTYTTFSGVDEPHYDAHQKTGFELMRFPSVWPHSTGEGVVVAVLDTGINIRHQEFCPDAETDSDNQKVNLKECTKLVSPYDFIHDATPGLLSPTLMPVDGADYEDPDGFPDDKDGHGTHVAGIIGAEVNNLGMSGAAYGVSMMPIRVMAPYYEGGVIKSTGFTSHIIQGINYAVANGADIINMSLGGKLGTEDDQLMRTAIDNATVAGVLVIAAAGNDSENFDTAGVMPAYYDNVLSVASVTQDGSSSNFTNYGESLDVAAFGGQSGGGSCVSSESVYSAHKGAVTQYLSTCGTSMAAPFVSGLAAIIKSYYKNEKNITLTPAEIRRVIQMSAQRDSDEKTLAKGYGIIDAQQALAFSGVTGLIDSNDQNLYYGNDGNVTSLVCYPNPFNSSTAATTTCGFYLSSQSTIQSWVYSRRGQLIYTTSFSGVGKQSITWDGRDRNASLVPNGVYQMVLKITPESSSHSPKTLRHLITVFR